MWNDRFRDPCRISGRACFDPGTLTMASMGATAVGGGLSALGTIAGGNAAAEAGKMQQASANNSADQMDENAAQAIASGQRQMLDTQQKVRMAMSTARTNAAGNGTDASFGSPVSVEGQLAKRGSYNAAMDMFNGQSTATGLRNQADATRYTGQAAAIEGQEKQDASYLSAAGTLAGSAGTMFKTAGNYYYPTTKST